MPLNGGCRVHGRSTENVAVHGGSPLVGARLFNSGQVLDTKFDKSNFKESFNKKLVSPQQHHTSSSVVLADGGVPGRSAAKFVSLPGSAPSARRYLGSQQQQQQQRRQQQQQQKQRFQQQQRQQHHQYSGTQSQIRDD